MTVGGEEELPKAYLFHFLANGSKKVNIHMVGVASKSKAFHHCKINLCSAGYLTGGWHGALKSPAAREGSTLAFLTR